MHEFNRLFIIVYIISSFAVFSKNINSEKRSGGLTLINSDFQAGIINKEELFSQKFYYVFDREKLNTKYNTENDQPVKCATQIIREYTIENKNFSSSKNGELNLYLNSTSTLANSTEEEHYISPSGIFELNYETSGVHSVPLYDNDLNGIPDYIEMIAGYCDYSWKFLVDTLGYLQPNINGRKYQIDFQKMYAAGFTINDLGDKNYTKIVLNNNLIEFGKNYGSSKDSMGTAKSTVVHELKHAVQYEYTKWRDKSWFLELDATWVEDIAYDDVNSYYNFLNTSQITNPASSFAQGMGYGNCIWMHYLTQSFGVQINKEIWETASSKRNISFTENTHYDIFNEVLSKYNSSLSSAAAEYFVWNYFSGSNTNYKLPGYKESANYPRPKICYEVPEIPFAGQGFGRERLSANFIVIKSSKEEQLFEIKLDFKDSENKVVLIEKFTTGDINIKYLEQKNNLVYYVSETLLKDIAEIVVIPVSLSSNSGDYEYTYQINYINISIDLVNPVISVMNSETQLNKENFPYRIVADIFDETGIDNAYIEYKFDNGNIQTTGLNKLEENVYCGYVYLDSAGINDFKELNYRIVASDSAASYNTSYFPVDGFSKVMINNSWSVTSAEQEDDVINGFSLSQNYPNPFNPSTKINYSVPKSGDVKIEVFDLLGKKIETLVNKFHSQGNYSVIFNSQGLSSGIYFYKFETKGFSKTKKMQLIK